MTAVSRDNRSDIADLLAFYASAGVDEALEEEPLNRFAEAASKPPERAPATVTPPTGENAALPRSTGLSRAGMAERQAAAPAARAPTGTATVPDEQQAALARHLATTAATLDELRQHMAAFDGCNLKFTAKNLVFADGNPNAAVMLVGEAPGRDEDIEGLPFVGRSGRLLDRMLAAIGLDRTSAYIANVIPWRPPGNRTPTPHETEICRPFIERQIELVNPKVLVNLGGPSASTLLNTTEGILRLRGNWRVHTTAAGIAIPAMPTLHPAYLLRTPAHKKLAWRDFLEVKAKLRALG
ncbi:uracil-DNA glycosylase [Mesorhizobium sp.]|uniref:uracil-DNA glycosylase n=1 Tax=Mesorhizobium sp. TaxID=1871066 RepID=UPI000FE6F3E6|nr:uracil-DNA glycosylase [Mesorhizobium sp.]RWO51977.1 MAG: uracil-DNA glycosylase [Mesorhizobium sp.]TIN24267.1 MAG: uracil-DNA glycosylase [Mesorhizobium sp.]TIN39643.1 MAG: uracil-DNA glycosylase [Mesorhizobium sp.]TJU81620.1 MAG: uracil-DNA glycosylase [Mesorhizobium sp.]TJU90354.1 MAG: uracil-DNA glycosylase [Mesorhizobium sp.]